MNPRRHPSLPPKIPGFDYVGLLGMGGFADVFEYTQDFPRRPVAVKVLLSTSLDESSQDAFFAEANIMAGLSQHPSIVAIHQAAIAPDGRPYFVMEYCAKPSLGARFRSERISVAEVLRTGIRVASAVETAHRSGVLHRDIKPANILATDFGWPALTDFGIAGAMGAQIVAAGMSIPWAPPEVLGESPVGDARSDVYSLAATLHTLLAGRSPFEVRGQSNSPLDLIARIENQAPPPIDRVDVPHELNVVLARGMHKNPDLRFASALALAHALQQIERKMQLPVTGIDVPEFAELAQQEEAQPLGHSVESFQAPVSQDLGSEIQEDSESTRLRTITSILPEPAVSPGPEAAKETRLRPITSIPAHHLSPVPPAPSQDFGQTQQSSLPAPQTMAPQPRVEPRQFKIEETTDPGYFKGLRRREEQVISPKGRTSKAIISIVSVLVLLGVLFVIGKNVLGSDTRQRETEQEIFEENGVHNPGELVPGVLDLTAVRSAQRSVTFTWVNPDSQEGDFYVWRVVDVGSEGPAQRITEPFIEVELPADKESVCIEVSLVRNSGKASNTPTRGCS